MIGTRQIKTDSRLVSLSIRTTDAYARISRDLCESEHRSPIAVREISAIILIYAPTLVRTPHFDRLIRRLTRAAPVVFNFSF